METLVGEPPGTTSGFITKPSEDHDRHRDFWAFTTPCSHV